MEIKKLAKLKRGTKLRYFSDKYDFTFTLTEVIGGTIWGENAANLNKEKRKMPSGEISLGGIQYINMMPLPKTFIAQNGKQITSEVKRVL